MNKGVKKSLSAILSASVLLTGFALPSLRASADMSLPAAGTQVQLYLLSDNGSSDAAGALSFTAGSALTADTVASANGGNYDSSPRSATTYILSGLTASYDSSLSTSLQAYLNSLTAGNGTQVQISYDFDGDGTADALQCYSYFATDGDSISWELYPASGLQTYGTMQNFVNGTVVVQVWNTIGNGSSLISTSSPSADQSVVKLPFRFTSYNPVQITPGQVPATTATKSPMTVPTAYASQTISSDWQNQLGEANLSPTAEASYVGSDGYLHTTTPQTTIHKTSNMTGATPTNSWESSILWQDNGYQPLYTLPLATEVNTAGLGVELPSVSYSKCTDGDIQVLRQYDANSVDLNVGADTFSPAVVNADKVTDWSADILMATADNSKSMKATLIEGSPYVYFIYKNANPKLTFTTAPTVVSGTSTSQALEVKTNGQIYGLFAPAGSTWSGLGTSTIVCNLAAGKTYFSIALLPNATADAFSYYTAHAYAFITNTEVRWRYNQSASTVETSYLITTTAMEGTNTDTITALLPSQWENNPYISTVGYTYPSIRGLMKTTVGTMFQTSLQYNGVLPNLGAAALQDSAVKSTVQSYMNELTAQSPLISGDSSNDTDTYYIGKGLGKAAQALPIANQLDDTKSAATLTQAMEATLDDFFTYSDSSDKSYFWYDSTWGTLIGYPASFGSDNELNDHYFHYGYFIMAAAELALQDPSWASQYGSMVNLLISDIANPDHTDTRFPFLRYYDPYQGHSWASGDDPFAAGNDQESASEAINAWAGIILWGEATGNTGLRDLGIYLYTNEVHDENTYNFNLYGGTFDIKYQHTDASQIWGGMFNDRIWWAYDPIESHGIIMLPVTTASLFLGTNKDYVRKNYDSIWTEWQTYHDTGDGTMPENTWQDIMCEYYAFYDPAAALSKWDSTATPEGGESKVHTYDFMETLNTIGTPDFTVTADTPSYGVFNKNGVKTYLAYNYSSSPVTVHFSDGTDLTVAANSLGSSSAGTQEQQTAAPVMSVAGGTYTSAQTVTISSATLGATIYYTTDGTTPTTSSTVYTAPITVSASETVKAIAVADEMLPSSITSVTYTISGGSSGNGSSYAIGDFTAQLSLSGTTLTVTLVPNQSGDTASNLWYTNVSNPTLLSQAIAGYAAGSKNSAGNYVITIPNVQLGTNSLIDLYIATNAGDSGWVAMIASGSTQQTVSAPTFSPAAGTYTSAQTVTIGTATSGATIYYTTDGTTPTMSSPVYSTPITVSASETVKAIAAESGMTNSAVSSAAYTINTSIGGSYAIGDFTAQLSRSGSDVTVTLTPNQSGDTASNLWYTNISDPVLLSQAIAGYAAGSKNSSGNYVVTIPNAQLGASGLIDLYIATNAGDSGWVAMYVS